MSSYQMKPKLVVPLLSVLFVGAFALIAWSVMNSHNQSCRGRNIVLSVLHDVIIDATTPVPGDHVTAQGRRDIQQLRTKTFARLAQAHCH